MKHKEKFLSPFQGDNMSLLRSESSMPTAESKMEGRIVSDNAESFKLFLKQNKPLAVYFLGPGRGHTHTDRPSLLLSFCNSRALVQLTSMQGWKYKQTLFLNLVWTQAIKQALEISNLIRKLKKKKTS